METPAAALEVRRGQRFGFGANWQQFRRLVGEERIAAAIADLQQMLGTESLAGKRFLDAGCGSGLSSLAARKLGAEVVAFDFDPESVAASQALRERFCPRDDCWQISQGSVLDEAYLKSLGLFDVVYSWGVLHHTGQMWRAMDLIAEQVAPGGQLFIALYNDQGWISSAWRGVKKVYCRIPVLRWPIQLACSVGLDIAQLAKHAALGDLREYFQARRRRYDGRGMSRYHDLVDWVGGYPFEVAQPAAVVEFYKERGFRLERQQLTRGLGCNTFVFRK